MIIAPLGAGGMGEVYRAIDTKLKREVAIKVLPGGFTQDKERLARFGYPAMHSISTRAWSANPLAPSALRAG